MPIMYGLAILKTGRQDRKQINYKTYRTPSIHLSSDTTMRASTKNLEKNKFSQCHWTKIWQNLARYAFSFQSFLRLRTNKKKKENIGGSQLGHSCISHASVMVLLEIEMEDSSLRINPGIF